MTFEKETKARYPKGPAAARGFSLIEVLVAVLVLAIGLLGLAALQSTAMKFTDSAASRTQATVLAYDILERMRANPDGMGSSAYDVDFSDNPTAGTMAETDLTQWKADLADDLPSGNGRIQTTDLGQNLYRVTVDVRWDDQRLANQNGLTDFQFQTEMQL